MNNGVREIKVIKPTLGANAERKLRMAAYCRVSTDSADQINSFMAQMRYYSDYIRSHDNMTFVDIYADEGITGTCINKRDEFKRMLKDCQNRKIDRILVKSVQRFARNSLECIESVRVFAECGVSVYFENDNIDTKNMNSEMILYIKSAFAQGESLSASKRMSTSFRMKMENGTFVTTTAPYGYRLVGKQLVICPEEAKVVKKIFIFSCVIGTCGTTSSKPSKSCSVSSSSSLFFIKAVKAPVLSDKNSSVSMQFMFTPFLSKRHGEYRSGVKNSFFLPALALPTRKR